MGESQLLLHEDGVFHRVSVGRGGTSYRTGPVPLHGYTALSFDFLVLNISTFPGQRESNPRPFMWSADPTTHVKLSRSK